LAALSTGMRIAATVVEVHMTTATMTEKDVRIRDAVQRQLEWDPEVDASAIGVAAKDGSVTLTGYIDSYAGKLAAERAAKRVRGVRAVANDVDVRLKLGRTDADIAGDAARALDLYATIPAGVKAAVHNGHVTLTGVVPWPYQKIHAEKIIRHIRGVRDVVNYLMLAPRAVEQDAHHRINAALHRNATVDARQIEVTVDGNTVTLTGTVRTLRDRDSAERSVADGPGITTVINHIVVAPAESDDTYELC
jgi:osmotically-inducible protein OsmY